MSIKGLDGSLGAYQAQMNRAHTAAAQRTPDAGGKPPQTAGSTPAQTSDKVNVSFDGVLRTTALSTAMNAADVRQEKVDAVRESLDNGTYVIDSRKIATKLVQDERAIFGR